MSPLCCALLYPNNHWLAHVSQQGSVAYIMDTVLLPMSPILRGGAAEPGNVATPVFLSSTPPNPSMVHAATRISGRRRPLPYLHDRYLHNYSKMGFALSAWTVDGGG
jgi:hypothetical protein